MNNKKIKNKENKIFFLIILIFFLGSIIIISVTSIYFSYNKEICSINDKILEIKKEIKEVEIKKSEKLNYKRIKEYAQKNNFHIDRDKYIKV